MRLSQRLLSLTEYIIKGARLADIGADHAGLALYSLQTGLVKKAVVTEVATGPYSRALKTISQSEYSDRIEVRLGDGLQPLELGEVETVAIAGMGGDVIGEILSFDWNKSASFSRFILQPMSKPVILRRILSQQGWPILNEILIREEGRFYVAIICQPGNRPYIMNHLEMDIGPEYLHAKDQVRYEYLRMSLDKYKRACQGLEMARQGICPQIAQFQEKIAELEERLNAFKT